MAPVLDEELLAVEVEEVVSVEAGSKVVGEGAAVVVIALVVGLLAVVASGGTKTLDHQHT